MYMKLVPSSYPCPHSNLDQTTTVTLGTLRVDDSTTTQYHNYDQVSYTKKINT